MNQLQCIALLAEKNNYREELKPVKMKYALLRRFIRRSKPKTSELIKLLNKMEGCTIKKLMKMHDSMFDDQYNNYGFIDNA